VDQEANWACSGTEYIYGSSLVPTRCVGTRKLRAAECFGDPMSLSRTPVVDTAHPTELPGHPWPVPPYGGRPCPLITDNCLNINHYPNQVLSVFVYRL